MTHGNKVPLVLIEWEDSARPAPEWRWLSDFGQPTVVQCVSVGFLIHDGDDVKALAPNMGGIDSEDSIQASGIITIPSRSITKIKKISEEG